MLEAFLTAVPVGPGFGSLYAACSALDALPRTPVSPPPPAERPLLPSDPSVEPFEVPFLEPWSRERGEVASSLTSPSLQEQVRERTQAADKMLI